MNKGKIVVVDDEKIVTSAFSTLLKVEGFSDAHFFNNPKDAVEFLKQNTPDLVISDFLMPEMNGLEFLSEVNKLYPEVSKILLTGYADKENAIKAINEINDDILRELKIKELSKEFDIDESIIKSKINNKIETKVVKETIKNKYNKYDLSELRILYLMINYEDIITVFENRLGSLIDDNRSLLAYKIMEFRNDYGYFSYSDFIDYINGDEKLINVLNDVNKCYNKETYTDEEVTDYIKTIKEYEVKKQKRKLEKQMSETLDINKKIEIAKKIQNINKEVLEW